MKKIFYLFAITSISLLISSCKKDYLDRKPISDLTIDNAIYNDETAIKAVNGAYGPLRSQKIYGDAYLKMMEVPSDDMNCNECIGNYPLWNSFGYLDTYSEFQVFWLSCYDGIQRCNFAITSISNSSTISPEVKTTSFGQLYFLRAYFYWLLTTVYGEVPIYTQVPQTFEEIVKPQSPVAEIYAQIEQDLKLAMQNLPESWSGLNKGRVTKYSAEAMLGKAYLYQRKWSEAKSAFANVIGSNKYKLNSLGYEANFNQSTENGEESLFEVQNYSGLASGAGTFFSDGGISGANNWRELLLGVKELTGSGNFGEIIGTRNLANEFEVNDLRLRATLWVQNCDKDTTVRNRTYCICNDKISVGTQLTPFDKGMDFKIPGFVRDKLGQYFWIRKGVPGSLSPDKGIKDDYGSNIPVIRYSDVLLMYAEASAETNDLGEAIAKLNLVRARVNLPPFPYTTQYGGHVFKDFTPRTGPVIPWLLASGVNVQYSSNLDDFRKALVHERRVELAAEYHRLNDLIRWSYIPGHPGNAFDVFAKKKDDPIERTAPNDHVTFFDKSRFFPKPLVEIDKSQGTLKQNQGY